MASVAFSAVGFAIGGPLGGAIGGFIGSQIDRAVFSPTVKIEGPRLSDLSVQTSTYGQPIPRLFGPENRVAGNIIWSTGLVETETTESQGGKGGGGTQTTNYTYHVDCAISLCRGQIASVKRIWADGQLFRDADGVQEHAADIRIYLGTPDQMPDPLIQAVEGADRTPGSRDLAYVVFEGLQLSSFGNRIPNFTFEVEAHSTATVATVIEELCGEAEVPYLDAARTDYLDIRGYTVSTPTAIRGVLDPLRAAFFFDMSEIEGELQFFPVDAPPTARVPAGDLGAHPFGTDRPRDYEAGRVATTELPRQIVVQHRDPARDYQINSQGSRRATVKSRSDLTIELPLVLTANEAKSIAERAQFMTWLRRTKVSCQIPSDYLHVEAGNKIVVPLRDGKERVLRVLRKETRLPGQIVLECETDGAAVLTRAATASVSPVPPQAVQPPGTTIAHLMDLPILRDEDDSSGFYVAGNGAAPGWRGAVVYRSLDAGLNYNPFVELTRGAVIGQTSGVLGVASPHYFDRFNTVTVVLLDAADALESVSELQVLAGANACAIGGEVLQFTTANLVAPQTYELSGFLRGRKGTEDRIAGHAGGERFVLLSGEKGIYRPSVSAGELGIERHFKPVSLGTLLVDAPVQTFTHTGRWAKPYAPVHARAIRDGTGNLTGSFIRRTRLEAPWLDGVDYAPLGETAEAYEIDVMDGVSVVRTIAVAIPEFEYSAADQTTDFGSAQAAIDMRIYQISSRVGRGLALEVTL